MRFFILFLIPLFSFSQEITLFDFGSNSDSTINNWNNIIVTAPNQTGLNLGLIDFTGNYTGETIELTDGFDTINNSGTTSPNTSLPFPVSSTQDNLFGEQSSFGGQTNTTAGFILSNLNSSKYYSFSFFASRMGVSDNRETLYTVIGLNTISNTLNPSNNTSNTSDIYNIQPDANGRIEITVTSGNNNTNSYGFYYLGALKMVSTTSLFSDFTESNLSLIYPNGNENWEVGKTVSIEWESFNLSSNIDIEYSTDNGSTWNLITTVNANTKKYDWQIPNNISNECLVRISSNTKNDISSSNFSIIENNNLTYKIIIIGSSTAAGTGPIDVNDAWVWKYDNYLTHIDTRFKVVNLAQGGFTTYNLLPTGTNIPNNISQTIDTQRNITKALSLNPNGVIINLPSNDANFNYPAVDQIANYHLIIDAATTQNIPIWISTPQPKNFGTDTNKLSIQLDMLAQTPIEFGVNRTLDFWHGFNISNNNGLKPEFNADGTHMNATGHRVLFERVKTKGIHNIVKTNVDTATNADIIFNQFINIYPNPFTSDITIRYNDTFGEITNIIFYDIYGKIVSQIKPNTKQIIYNSIKIKPFKNKRILKGIYYCKIDSNNKSIIKKIVLN